MSSINHFEFEQRAHELGMRNMDEVIRAQTAGDENGCETANALKKYHDGTMRPDRLNQLLAQQQLQKLAR